MKIEIKKITIREVVENYLNDDEEGVLGYDGKLNIRPKYQREFIYKEKERDAVIETVRMGFPLNLMYWGVNEDGIYELIDGQQRTISICEYVEGNFSIDFKYFETLTDLEKEQILDYKLMVCYCEGTDKEKLDWFSRINIAGKEHTIQELRNAIYTGDWLTDAKRYFSKTGCVAYNIAEKYMKGTPIRQDYLETVIRWISDNNIEQHMADNQNEDNADELWLYFQNVINWVKVVFPNYRREMKGVEFGFLYNKFKDNKIDSKKLEIEITKLMRDDDVTKKAGIYKYVLTGNEKYLSIRAFTDNQKRETYEKQQGICIKCNKHFEIEGMEADHITPWCSSGKTISENCQMLCKPCNRTKAGK